MSVCGPKDHQRIISKHNTGLGTLFYREHNIALEPFPETMLIEGQASPVPDLLLYDNETAETPIIVEVCHQEGLKHDLRKVVRLVDEGSYGIQAAFVYNYKTHDWHRYRKDTGWITDTPSYSAVLQLDLNQVL